MATGARGLVLGVDVGAHALDVVALGPRQVPLVAHAASLREFAALLDELRPALVAVDAPARRARRGPSRACERELNDMGIRCFYTPARLSDIPFYDWVRHGFRVYETVRARRIRTVEVFPHASAVVLARRLARGESKGAFRRRVLRDHDVDVKLLRTQDQVDAALAAITGLRKLAGRAHPIGTTADGQIWLPARPRARYT